MYRIALFFLLLLGCSFAGNAQVREITTIAGSNIAGAFGGDGGPATACEFHGPNDVTVDAFGNVYVEDFLNFRIRKINTLGIITTYAGTGTGLYSGDGGPAAAADMKPNGVTTDAHGDLYISDNSFNVVRKVNVLTDIISIYAGWPYHAGNSGDGGLAANTATLSGPRGMCVDYKGNLYIADVDNHVIRKVDSFGNITRFAGTYGCPSYAGDLGFAINACLDSPVAVAADKIGNIYIADYKNNVIRKVDTFGEITTVAGNNCCQGYNGDGLAATAAWINGPRGVAVDKYGFLYISDSRNNRIRMVDTLGKISTVVGNGTAGFGGDGSAAVGANLYFPQGIAVDSARSIYIGDADNQRVRKAYFPTLGVTTVHNDNALTLAPNPANSTVIISGFNSGDNAVVYDLIGRQLLVATSSAVDIHTLATGTYLMRVQSATGVTRATMRFVKM